MTAARCGGKSSSESSCVLLAVGVCWAEHGRGQLARGQPVPVRRLGVQLVSVLLLVGCCSYLESPRTNPPCLTRHPLCPPAPPGSGAASSSSRWPSPCRSWLWAWVSRRGERRAGWNEGGRLAVAGCVRCWRMVRVVLLHPLTQVPSRRNPRFDAHAHPSAAPWQWRSLQGSCTSRRR